MQYEEKKKRAEKLDRLIAQIRRKIIRRSIDLKEKGNRGYEKRIIE